MKLLICTFEYYPCGTGIANVAYNVVEQFKKMGVDCTVCSPTGPDIKVFRPLKEYGFLSLVPYWYKVDKYFEKRVGDYDVSWIHNPLFLKNNSFQRSLITMHTTYHGYMIKGSNPKNYYKVASKVEKYCLNKMCEKTRFTGVDLVVCEELEGIGINRQKITYIPNGVDAELFKPSDRKKMLRRTFELPEDDLIILSLGRLTYQKQPQKLIEVFSLVEKTMKCVTLVIAGTGKLLEDTKKLAIEKNLKNVKFLGYVKVDDVPDLYACSDYYIMASKYEGQPLTLLEAMAAGLPCIVSDIPNLRIVKDVECGIILDFDNFEKAAGEIVKYLNRDNSRHSKNAREYAVNNLNWEVIAEKYLENFEKVI